MWIGAPGEPIPTGVAIRITNLQNGEPVAGATVTWESFGPNGVVVHASAHSDAKGLATAVWQLGTSAGEQQLLVSVRSGQRTGEIKLRALAVPHVVAQLRISVDSLTVVRLGDSLPISVTAVDPYGNVFAPPAPRLSSSDSTVGTAAGSVFVAGPRRGATELEIVSDYVRARIPLRVVQHVAAIIPQTNALSFTSLGAELPIRYAVLDDRGRLVADTTAALSVADTTVAQLSDTLVRALKTGSTELRYTVGTATTTIPVAVQQRIASLRLQPDSIRFDALRDTATFQPVAVDSLGFPIPNPDLVYELSDGQVVTLAGASLLEAAGPGVSLLTLRDPVTSVSVMMPIVVQQRVASIDLAPVTFDALGDTILVPAVARDRLGYRVQDAALIYAMSDTVVAGVFGDRLYSRGEGVVTLTAQDPITGTLTTANVVVAQLVTSVVLDVSDAWFDALGDTVSVGFTARDRLGAIVASAAVTYMSSDTTVVRVSGDGSVESQWNGSAVVRVTSSDGPYADVRVVVAQIARTMTAVQRYDRGIVTLPVGSLVPVECQAYDSNGYAVPDAPVLESTSHGTVTGGTCNDLRVARSGYDTLVLATGSARATLPLIIAASPVASSRLGDIVVTDRPIVGPWAPSIHRSPSGDLEVYSSSYVMDSSVGYTRANLHRLKWLGGNSFAYDSVAISHADSICDPQGQGIENMTIMPKSEGPGWRMLYAAGSFECYGWQVFSAVSTDGRTWTKEPGVRLANGSTGPTGGRPWPAGEGMQAFQLTNGEWQLIVSTFEHVLPPPANQWAITEWRSTDQLNWTYVGPVLTVRDMPTGWQGSVYSPTIHELAPGLWRMVFTADGRNQPGSRSALWSAVSTDRQHWQIESELLGDATSNLMYSSLDGDQLVFLRRDVGDAWRLAIATIRMP
jgi:hypothetical protein